MANRGVRYTISSAFDNKGAKAAQKSLATLGDISLRSAAKFATAGLSVQKFGMFLRESTQAALADQKAQANLNHVLANSGFAGATVQVTDYISRLQSATGVTEEQLRPAFLNLFNALGSTAKAQEALNVAMDVSAATGKDLATVTSAMNKAATGTKTSLMKLGLGIKKTDLAAANFDETLAMLNRKFAGASATAAETMSGKMDRLRAAIGEGKETIGYALLDVFSQLAGNGDIVTATDNISKFSSAVGEFIRQVSGAKEPTNMFSGYFHDMSTGIIDDVKLVTEAIGRSINSPGSPLSFIGSLGKVAQAVSNVGTTVDTVYGTANTPFTTGAIAKLNADAERRRKREEALAKAAAAKAAALARAERAQKARQAALEKKSAETQMTYDIERIGLMKALSEAQSSETARRLTDLLKINTLTYAEALGLDSIESILKLINEQMEKWYGKQSAIKAATDSTTASYDALLSKMNASAAAAGLGRDFYYSTGGSTATAQATAAALANISEAQAASALTNLFPEADRASAGSGNFGAYGTNVTVNIGGSLLAQQDLEAAIAGAVNSSARAGVAYSQIFSRL